MKGKTFFILLMIFSSMLVWPETFHSPKGISLYYPDGWKLMRPKTQPHNGDTFLIVNFWDNDDFKEMLTLEIFSGAVGEPTAKTVEDMKNTTETYMKNKGNTLKTAYFGIRDFNDRKIAYLVLEVTDTRLSKDLALEQLRFHGDRYWYQITFACKAAEHDYYKQIFTRILNSVKVENWYETSRDKWRRRAFPIFFSLLALAFILMIHRLSRGEGKGKKKK